MSLAVFPPAIAVTPFGNRLLIGERGVSACQAAILLRALAAAVFADSTSFLKNPLFLAFGVVSPPRSPPESVPVAVHSIRSSEPGLDSRAE